MSCVENTVTTPLNHLDLVVQSFHKSTGMPLQKIMSHLVFARHKCFHEAIETANLAMLDTGRPTLESVLRLSSGNIFIKDRCQWVAKYLSLLQSRRIFK